MSSVNWNARLSDIALNVKPSPIRALMKYTKTPGVISFAGGNPDLQFSRWQSFLKLLRSWHAKAKMSFSTVPQTVMRRSRDTSQNGWHPEWAVKQNLKRCLSNRLTGRNGPSLQRPPQ